MRGWPIALAILLTGCGYMGEPLPPALKRPVRVTDLAAVERGSKIILHFTVPKVTTENLPVSSKENIDLRLGIAGADGFQIEQWLREAEKVPVLPQDKPTAEVEVDTGKYVGKTVVAMVRVIGPSGHDAGWSNAVALSVVPALGTPQRLQAQDAPDAVRLTWQAAAPEFRIFRKTAEAAEWVTLGTSTAPAYSDSTIVYGTKYLYNVQAIEKTGERYAESNLSETIPFEPHDHFAPAVPAALNAEAGARTIELVWERNTERDFASYRVYRDGQKIADGLTAPAFSDADVKPATRYGYQVTAVDTTGNESQRSGVVEVTIP